MAASNSTTTPSNDPSALSRSTERTCCVAGSDGGAEHWATIASLIETCKLNDADPLLSDRRPHRTVNGHPNSDIDQLLPWAYRKPDLQAVACHPRHKGWPRILIAIPGSRIL